MKKAIELATLLAVTLLLLNSTASAQIITTVAGNGTPDFCGDGGPATDACLYYPRGVAVDGKGNLFIADTGNARVRRVDLAAGIITTVVGNGTPYFCGDGGPATSACLDPRGVALDVDGNLFIADGFNDRIRRVDAASGTITTVAGGADGFCGDGGPATSACLRAPYAVAVDTGGNLFIVDTYNRRIRRVDGATGVITTVAGNGEIHFCGDGGPATSACLYTPEGVAVDVKGNLFIGDTLNWRVRGVDAATQIITTLAGGTWGFCGDGGPATEACMRGPRGVAVDVSGNLFIADTFNSRVRLVQ